MSLPKPYYEDTKAGITIYHADCREILPLIPDKSIDLVLTDPPWNLGYFDDDSKSWEEYSSWLSGITDILVTKSRVVWIYQSTKAIPYVAHLFKGWGMFASCKNFCQMTPKHIPNAFDVAFFNSHEGFSGKGRNWHIGKTSILNNNNHQHPTSRPEDTIAYIISLYALELVLDPFLGSGTTAYCAKKLGRKCIGIEISEAYCEIAAKRLSQEVMDLGL